MKATRRSGLFLVFVLLAGAWPSAAPAEDASFTSEQAAKGKKAYRQHCAVCHGDRLEGKDISPPLQGPRFDASWRGKPAGNLSFHLHRMPPEPAPESGALGDEKYANILAFLLETNGITAGDEALPTDVEALARLTIPTLPGSDYDPDKPVVAAGESELLRALPTVTKEMLRSPSPDDWLLTGSGYSARTYSPLDQINRETVANLGVAWRAPLREGNSMPIPIVFRGVMFLQTFPDTVLALDAANGRVLWRYQYETSGAVSQKMGVALGGDKVFVPTSDKHVLALEAKTGKLVWDHAIRLETPEMSQAYQLRSAPLVVGNKVLQGVTASFVPKGGFMVALDIETGEEAWRFHSIPAPGEPNGESWNDVRYEKRSGGSIWQQASYDPELNLIYFGIAPTYDTGPLVHPVDNVEVNSKALYTNCTVALNPDTGELVWYYQHVENDQWDLDWVFERQIATVPIDGVMRKVVMNIGKMGILEAVDAATGEYLFSVDTGIQNVITAIDPKTGAKTIDPQRWPDPERQTDICPSALGARSWPPTSYDPATQMLYVPLNEICMSFGKEGGRLLTSGVGIGPATHPDAADGKIGRVQAIDLTQQKLAWVVQQESPISTGLLATGGGLVFAGDIDPSLKAYDASTGELLWEKELDANPSSGLITYSVDGTQYVAAVLGMKNFHIGGLAGGLGRMVGGGGRGAAEGPSGGAAIWVFQLN